MTSSIGALQAAQPGPPRYETAVPRQPGATEEGAPPGPAAPCPPAPCTSTARWRCAQPGPPPRHLHAEVGPAGHRTRAPAPPPGAPSGPSPGRPPRGPRHGGRPAARAAMGRPGPEGGGGRGEGGEGRIGRREKRNGGARSLREGGRVHPGAVTCRPVHPGAGSGIAPSLAIVQIWCRQFSATKLQILRFPR